MEMNEKITKLILDVIEEQNPSRDVPVDISAGEATNLYGRDGVLNSLALVRLIVALESRVEDEFGVQVILADEKAMSQKRSPFATVGALSEYILKLITDDASQA